MLARIENHAAAIGPNVYSWWKDWSGKACAIVASGPSLRKADIALLRGRLPVLAIKKNVELCPWADVVYGCDPAWWNSVQGLRDFKGLRLAYDQGACKRLGLEQIRICKPSSNDLSFQEPGVVGAGGNSGFQALNIVAQFGASRILLLGYDMDDRAGAHWYGRNNWTGANNPTQDNFRRWRLAFNNAARQLEQLGVEVVNASGRTSLTCFPRGTVAATLERWGL